MHKKTFAGDGDAITITVPAGGNTFTSNNEELVGKQGVTNWTNKNTSLETYVRVNQAGSLHLFIHAKADAKSVLSISIAKLAHAVTIANTNFALIDAGEWTIKDTGYIKIAISGVSKSGNYFADIQSYQYAGAAINQQTAYVKNNDGNFFYWGRRGPSVHLGYPVPDTLNAEWFYNEVTVPKGEDVIGSYFMANGFAEGYFGIQVNSPTERRILFSLWSPFTTDDPKAIPKDMQITMLRKGDDVHTGEFGNEGAGGQSYLKYYWQAGNTYKFLLHAKPDGNGATVYTAYFFAPEKNQWQLIASFSRPKTNTYLKHLHSFLENFDPAQGNKTRKVLFGNQWICDTNGRWTELNHASFTGDNTARIGFRMDYGGGVDQNKFYLQNCGFFSQYTKLNSKLERPLNNKAPQIDFSVLH